ncbi:hypothetical protein EFZ10_03610 [Tatumella sp. TA1]|nr:hypothetical protein EFZ10_03610 [Tatumella sp. TA1]
MFFSNRCWLTLRVRSCNPECHTAECVIDGSFLSPLTCHAG